MYFKRIEFQDSLLINPKEVKHKLSEAVFKQVRRNYGLLIFGPGWKKVDIQLNGKKQVAVLKIGLIGKQITGHDDPQVYRTFTGKIFAHIHDNCTASDSFYIMFGYDKQNGHYFRLDKN